MKRFAHALSAFFLLFLATAGAEAATYIVTTTNDSGAGSLRQAILDANATDGVDDVIEFDIPAAGVQTITPLTSLPSITDPVILDGYTQTGASPNTLAIGSDAVLLIEIDGTTAGGVGIRFTAAGGSSTLRGLVVNRFLTGIYLDDADDMVIAGNHVGTDATGTLDRGNTGIGIALDNGAQSDFIGGNAPSARNVIAGSKNNVSLGSPDTLNNVILGNYIGVTAAGTASIPGEIGINVNNAGPNTIGGAGSGGNIISGHTQGPGAGISIINPSEGIQIHGNIIGLGADAATPVPNQVGIRIGHGLSGSPVAITIGSAGAPNVIASNLQEGIVLSTNGNTFIQGVAIDANSIHDNGQLGIDIGDNGVTPNDTLDGDAGNNDLQNFPVVSAASSLGGNLTIGGSLHSAPHDMFTVRLYHSGACDSSGNGEAATPLGSVVVNTNASGNAVFNATMASALTTGVITATATNTGMQNTSELSLCQAIAVVVQPSATIGDVSVIETNAGTTVATFTIFLSAAPPAGASISYTTANGTATIGDNDYVAESANAVFAAGQTAQTIDVTINGDASVEPDETFLVNLTGATNATIADNQAVGTIRTDDSVPVLTIADASTPEGNVATIPLSFTVSVSPAPAFDVTVSYVTSDGSAVAPEYATTSGTVTIPAGSTSATFDVNVNGDTMYELDETFTVTLFNASNATISVDVATGTILNDDPIPTVTINDPSAAEGNVGNSPLTFTATLSNPTYLNVSIPYTIANDSATAGSDYITQSGAFTFISPQITRNLDVSVIGDTTPESDETFFVNLGAPSNAAIGDNQSVGTILDDDNVAAAPDLAVTKTAPASVALGQTFAYTIVVANAGAGSATNVTLTDVLPSEVTFVSSSSTQGVCSGTTTVTCVIGTLVSGGSATVMINVTATTAGPIANTASVLASETEGNSANNSDAAVVTAAAATAAIPTLSEWGLIAMLLALTGLAVARARM